MTFRMPFAVAGLGAVLAAGSALAQQSTPPAAPPPAVQTPAVQAPAMQAPTTGATVSVLRAVKDEKRIVMPWNLSVDKIDDMKVHGATGDRIGEVDKVLEDATGQVTALVVEFGGFLGMGETEVIVPLAQLTVQGDRLVTTLTKEQLKALPRWKS